MTIAFWNANGLSTKKTELEEFVQRHQLDAVLIGETHLRAGNRLTLPNFRVYRTDRENARGGGTAILVKSTIEHHADLALDLTNIEATAVTVNLATGPVKLVAAYKAPNRQLLEDDLSEIFDTRGAVILAGDLNAKHPSWNSRRTNASGTCLRRFADDLHLLVDATAEPTIYPHNGQPDVLDIVVMKDVAQFHQLTVLNELSSDHNPVLLQLGQAAPEDEEPRMRQTVSWPAFANHLSAHIGPITAIGDPIELEAAVRQVTERVADSVRYATNTTRAVDDRAFIPREVRDLIREKNRLRRQWQRTLNPATKAEYNRTARRTKIALDEFRNNRWGDFMERASESPSEFWRAVKALKGQRVPVPPIHGARGVAFTTEDKAEAFAETLERQCSPVYENVDVDRIGRIHRQVRDLLTAEEDDEEPIRPTSPEEVIAIVKSFRPTKAPGPDGVTYRVLKHAPKKFVMHMTNICNAMLRLRHFPSQWKLADVVMIPKPGQSHNWPQNYRPISLLPVMSKIADRIILARLREETDDLDVIPDCQFGFRREHSTTHQVLRLVEHIKEGFNRRECTGAVFLDVAKAFDKVWHQGLLAKMHRAGISKAMVKLVHSFLRKRTFQVKLEGRRSTTRTATAGVPQGSAISPLLFNIYTSDIPTTAHVNLAMYADDVCIYSRSLNARVIDRRLQAALDTLRDWYAKWRIAVHPQKSTAVLFAIGGRRRRKFGNAPDLTFQGGIIPWQREVTYLGVTLDSRVNWGAHINRVLDRGRKMFGTLYPMMAGGGRLDPSLKVRIYKTVLRPTITYASAVWATALPTHIKKLEAFQSRTLRSALSAPWYVRNTTIQEDTGVEPLMDFIRRIAARFFEQAVDHSNPLVSESQAYDPRIPWKYARPRSLVVANAED
ncbi:hypothetical protein Trydic_g7254 [Trypoxylus dichotomus]